MNLLYNIYLVNESETAFKKENNSKKIPLASNSNDSSGKDSLSLENNKKEFASWIIYTSVVVVVLSIFLYFYNDTEMESLVNIFRKIGIATCQYIKFYFLLN